MLTDLPAAQPRAAASTPSEVHPVTHFGSYVKAGPEPGDPCHCGHPLGRHDWTLHDKCTAVDCACLHWVDLEAPVQQWVAANIEHHAAAERQARTGGNAWQPNTLDAVTKATHEQLPALPLWQVQVVASQVVEALYRQPWLLALVRANTGDVDGVPERLAQLAQAAT